MSVDGAPGHGSLEHVSPVLASSGRAVVFNGAGAGTGPTNLVALVENGVVVAERRLMGRGASEQFAPCVRDLLDEARWYGSPDVVVAVVGPGSFTGLRASLSLAAGLAAGWTCPVRGVTAGAAIRATLGRSDVVCVSVARRGRVFVDAPDGSVVACQTRDLDAQGWAAVSGDAVSEETPAEIVDLCNFTGTVIPCSAPTALGILKAAVDFGDGIPFQPLYVDPPEAKPPAAGLRPAPSDLAS